MSKALSFENPRESVSQFMSLKGKLLRVSAFASVVLAHWIRRKFYFNCSASASASAAYASCPARRAGRSCSIDAGHPCCANQTRPCLQLLAILAIAVLYSILALQVLYKYRSWPLPFYVHTARQSLGQKCFEQVSSP